MAIIGTTLVIYNKTNTTFLDFLEPLGNAVKRSGWIMLASAPLLALIAGVLSLPKESRARNIKDILDLITPNDLKPLFHAHKKALNLKYFQANDINSLIDTSYQLSLQKTEEFRVQLAGLSTVE